jgi:hypothetical protein
VLKAVHGPVHKCIKLGREAFCARKGPIFSLISAHCPFWNNSERKCTDTLADFVNILQKVMRDYSLVEYSDTMTILLKTLLITTLLITVINVTLHIRFLFTVISKVSYK